MKKRIISMLLAGMMVLNSAVVYADADITGDYTTYADTFLTVKMKWLFRVKVPKKMHLQMTMQT